jgi:hypothetical protein
MIFLPMSREIMSEVITAAAALKEMKLNTPAPGIFSESRYLNR